MSDQEQIVSNLVKNNRAFAIRIRRMSRELLVEVTHEDGVINLRRPNSELNFWKSMQDWAE